MPKGHPSAILFLGDGFLIEERIRAITLEWRQAFKGEVSNQVVYLAEASLDNLFLQARTLPFLMAAQIIQVRDIEKIKSKDLESLESYLQNPSKTSLLCFESAGREEAAGIIPIFQAHASIESLDSKDQRTTVTQFIRKKISQAGKTITPRASQTLEDTAGEMPSFLDSMLERLINYSGNQSMIDEDMVEKFEEDWSQGSIFDVTNAISEKNTAKGIELLNELMSDNAGDVLGLLGLLHWQVKRLWLANHLLDLRYSEDEIFKKCKVSYKQSRLFSQQMRRFSKKKLSEAIEGLFQLDWKVKTGRVHGPTALETWFVELTQ